jgi:hypothetical protein
VSSVAQASGRQDRVDGRDGGGSVFYVELPAAPSVAASK